MADSIIITKKDEKFEVTIIRGKQCRWLTIDEEEAVELINKLTKELGVEK